MNKFQRSARSGKLKKALANSEYELESLESDDFSVNDAVATRNGKRFLVETKHRRAEYEDYLLEEKKAFSLAYKALDAGMDGILYVNTFEKGIAIIWNITQKLLNLCRSGSLYCPRTTEGNNTKISKKVFYLKPENGTTVKY